MTTVAYPMLVLYLTNSPVYAGFAVFAATAPGVLAYIPAGALVDRWDPRQTMLVSEAGRGIIIAIVVGLLAFHWPSVPLIIGLAIIEEILEVFSTLAERRCIPVLVEQDDAPSALVRAEARTHAVVLAGRPLGGLLFELRPILPFLADAFSFLISFSALSFVRYEQPIRPARVSPSQLSREIRVGLHWLRCNRFARIATPLSACTTLIFQALIMVFIADAHTRHLSSTTIGIVLSASGLGGAIGAVIESQLRLLLRLRILDGRSRIEILLFIWSVAFFILTVSTQSWQIPCMAAVMVVLGFTGAKNNLELDTYLIREVPESMFARVTSVGRLMTFSANAAGPAIGGILVGSYGIQFALSALFLITLFLTIISIRKLSMPRRRALAVELNDTHDKDTAVITGQAGEQHGREHREQEPVRANSAHTVAAGYLDHDNAADLEQNHGDGWPEADIGEQALRAVVPGHV